MAGKTTMYNIGFRRPMKYFSIFIDPFPSCICSTLLICNKQYYILPSYSKSYNNFANVCIVIIFVLFFFVFNTAYMSYDNGFKRACVVTASETSLHDEEKPSLIPEDD